MQIFYEARVLIPGESEILVEFFSTAELARTWIEEQLPSKRFAWVINTEHDFGWYKAVAELSQGRYLRQRITK